MKTGYNTLGITAIVVLILGSAALGVPPARAGGPRRAGAGRLGTGNRPGRLGTLMAMEAYPSPSVREQRTASPARAKVTAAPDSAGAWNQNSRR